LWTLVLAVVSVDVLALLPAEEPARAAGVQITVSDKVLNEIDTLLFGRFMERPSWGEICPEAVVIPGTGKLQPQARQAVPVCRVPRRRAETRLRSAKDPLPAGLSVTSADMLMY